jgi:hypothetical protein
MGKILIATVVNTFICCLSFAQGNNKIPFAEIGSLSLDSGTAWVERVFNNSTGDEVQIVGLGEVSHGGYEPLALKAKMIQYLVEKRGYRNILLELPDIENIRPVRQYLLNNNSRELSVADSLAKMATSGLLNAREVFTQLFRWLKLYNMAHPQEMVKVAGFDLSADEGFKFFFLYNYIIPFDHRYAQRLLHHWENIKVSDSSKIASINTWFNANKSKLVKEMSTDEFEELQYHLQNETASHIHGVYKTGISDEPDNMYRDSVMAGNVIRLAGSQKTIVWAHNGHISIPDGFMGTYLRKRYKSRYFILLTDFSTEANVYVVTGENTVYGANRMIREQHFAAGRTTVSYNLLKNYGISSGIFFSQYLPVSKVYNDLNIIDMAGKQVTMSADHAFDVLVIFNSIHPYPIPENNR